MQPENPTEPSQPASPPNAAQSQPTSTPPNAPSPAPYQPPSQVPQQPTNQPPKSDLNTVIYSHLARTPAPQTFGPPPKQVNAQLKQDPEYKFYAEQYAKQTGQSIEALPNSQMPPPAATPQPVQPTQTSSSQPLKPTPQTPNAVPTSAVPQPPHKKRSLLSRLKALFAIVVIFSAVGSIVFFALPLLKGESAQAIFEKTITQNLTVSTFRQVYNVRSEEQGIDMVIDAYSDFSRPAEPRSDMQLSIALNGNRFDTTDTSKVSAEFDAIAVGDTAWLRTTSFDTSGLSQKARESYEILAAKDESIDDVIKEVFGIEKLNKWEKHNLASSGISSSSNLFDSTILNATSKLNTILGSLVLANTESQATDLANRLLDAGVYTVNFNDASTEIVNATKYQTYDLTIDIEEYTLFNQHLVDTFGLSDRQQNFLDTSQDSTVEHFKLWIDPKDHRPYKVEEIVDDQTFTVEYSGFGSTLDIQPPV